MWLLPIFIYFALLLPPPPPPFFFFFFFFLPLSSFCALAPRSKRKILTRPSHDSCFHLLLGGVEPEQLQGGEGVGGWWRLGRWRSSFHPTLPLLRLKIIHLFFFFFFLLLLLLSPLLAPPPPLALLLLPPPLLLLFLLLPPPPPSSSFFFSFSSSSSSSSHIWYWIPVPVNRLLHGTINNNNPYSKKTITVISGRVSKTWYTFS